MDAKDPRAAEVIRFDHEISRRFLALHEEAASRTLDHWKFLEGPGSSF